METNLKPIRIPMQLPHKYDSVLRVWLLMLVWSLPAFGVVALNPPEWVLIVFLIVWILCLFAVSLVPFYYDLVFFPEGIQVRFLGRVIQQIPVSELKLMCVAGNDGVRDLCVSAWDVEELAQRREEKLLKGYFTRHDVPFSKKQPGWQARFANEYLLKPSGSILNFHTRSPILWMSFDPVVAIYLRRLYPQLPYVQLCSNRRVPLFMDPGDQIPYYTERFRIDEKGVHILGDFSKEERRLFPAERIQTIFRLDRFVQDSRSEQTFSSYLVVSELSLEELALRGKQKRWNRWKKQLIAQLPEAEEMYAVEFHFSVLFLWNWRKSTECHFWNTPETEAKLRQYFTHSRWVDYSEQWR